MTPAAVSIHRGRLRGHDINGSIKIAACEALGIQHNGPGVKLRGWLFVREPGAIADRPDVIFDLAVFQPPGSN